MFKRIASIVAYVALWLVSTLLFTYFLFPMDRLQDYITAQMNSGTKYRLEIDSIERDGLGTIVIEGMRIGVNRRLFKRSNKAPGSPLEQPKTEMPAERTAGKADDITGQDNEEPGLTPSGKAGASNGRKGGAQKVQDSGEEASGRAGEDDDTIPQGGSGVDKGSAGEEDGEFSFIEISILTIDFSIWDLFTPSDLQITLNGELLGGYIEDGQILLDSEQTFSRPTLLLPEITDLNLGETEFFGAIFSALLPGVKSNRVEGQLSRGSVELRARTEDESQYYSGMIELELNDVVATDPLLVNRATKQSSVVEMPLTDMRLGKCVFDVRVDRIDKIDELSQVKLKGEPTTTLFIERGECKGESIDYLIQKGSYVAMPEKGSFMRGSMDLWVKLLFASDYFDEKEVADGKPTTRNRELGQLLDMDRGWQQARDADGFYWMHCTGTLMQPKCRKGLPPEERNRKNQKRDQERAKKKAKAAASAGGARSGETGKPVVPGEEGQEPALGNTTTRPKKESLLEKRREAARKRKTATPSASGTSSRAPRTPGGSDQGTPDNQSGTVGTEPEGVAPEEETLPREGQIDPGTGQEPGEAPAEGMEEGQGGEESGTGEAVEGEGGGSEGGAGEGAPGEPVPGEGMDPPAEGSGVDGEAPAEETGYQQ